MFLFLARGRQRGFTLIELLVVIAVIAVLIALLVPAAHKVREAASRIRCQNSLRQLGLALHHYHSQQRHLPSGTLNPYGPDGVIELDRRTWMQEILPFIEQQAIYDEYLAWSKATAGMALVWENGMWNAAPNRWVPIPLLMCPSDPANPKTLTFGATGPTTHNQGWHGNYVLCAGSDFFNPDRDGAGPLPPSDGRDLNGLFYSRSAVRFTDISDGLSNTLMGSELLVSHDRTTHDTRGRYWNNARQGSVLFSTRYPPNTTVSDRLNWCESIPHAPCVRTTTDIVLSARSLHAGIVNVVLADGSVRTIANGVNAGVYNALGSRASGETPGDF